MEREAILESQIEVLKADRDYWRYVAIDLAYKCRAAALISKIRFATLLRMPEEQVDPAMAEYYAQHTIRKMPNRV